MRRASTPANKRSRYPDGSRSDYPSLQARRERQAAGRCINDSSGQGSALRERRKARAKRSGSRVGASIFSIQKRVNVRCCDEANEAHLARRFPPPVSSVSFPMQGKHTFPKNVGTLQRGFCCLFPFLCKGKTAPQLEGSQSSITLCCLHVKRFDEKCSFRGAPLPAVPALRRTSPPPAFPRFRSVD